jgi:hypothetical protein
LLTANAPVTAGVGPQNKLSEDKMRILITAMLLLLSTQAFAEVTLECERYTVKENKKSDWTIFTLSFVPENQNIIYKKISGPEWFLPSGSELSVLWKSEDGLRAVVTWLNEDYGKDNKVWHPVYIMDIDYSKPRYKMEHYGGFSDFSELVSSPWKQECKRLN